MFVTGTDTGVGKTLIACALLHAYAAQGLRVVGMKPVAAGATRMNGILVNEDVEQLIAASNVAVARECVNPFCFAPPIAPHLAAGEEEKYIKISYLCENFERLAALAERVIVEGAGGFLVPLNDTETFADLARVLALPVVLVVGMRLGCINHALLSAEAIHARGLVLAGWVANHIDPDMARADENVATLQARLGEYQAPLIARVAFSARPDAHEIASRMVNGALP